MKAAICLEQDQPLSVEEVTPLDPGPTDVIVRITASGVCHSDLSVINGTLPAGKVVLGHEGTGVVEKVGGDVSRVQVGDRVIGSFIPACGVCWYCLHDQSNLCAETYSVMFVPRVRRENGEDIQAMTGLGTFAEMMTVSQHSVVKVESDLPDEQLALIGCGVTTGVGAALNTARVEPGSIVAVIGCGGVGQAVIQGARIAGAARIIAIDPVAMKRDAALQLGATDVVDPGDADPIEAVRALSGGRGADYAFEVIGTAGTIRQAVETARPGGTAVMVGVPKLGTDVPIPSMSVLEEKTIRGCVYGSARVRRDFPRMISLIEQGKLDVGSMVTRTMHLHEVNDAIKAMQDGEVIRSVLV
ncbi:MAG TPA: Zn-dependent alcohol dehydrogenase [Acidimicrobiia bacterium]|jgi:S-(hydroxymethyl)glutathione dehydrogenase/alcohol dehydrogenase|nr:Zn-dependent alcohol dehydrogenase [Acidimicrobiia bacterium]